MLKAVNNRSVTVFPNYTGKENFSSRLKLYILITISNMFTKANTAVTAVWLFKFEVTGIASMSCQVLL